MLSGSQVAPLNICGLSFSTAFFFTLKYARQQAGPDGSNESPAAQRSDDQNDTSVDEANVESVENAAGGESQVSGLRGHDFQEH